MADIHWLNPVSGSFDTAADWSTGTVPGQSDAAYLDAAGSTSYTVTASTSEAVGFLQVASTATLAVTGGVFTDSWFTVVNAGTIAIGTGGSATSLDLDVSGGHVTLTGGGTISLGGAASTIEVDVKHGLLTNVDNTIVGSGTVMGAGAFGVTNEAQGVIDADSKTPLTIKAAGIFNAGLIETTGRGHCTLIGGINNTGILEANGGKLTVKKAVFQTGSAVISAGTIDFKSAFNQNVSFTGKRGTLELAQPVNYTASISGFSLAGKTLLDLRHIHFVDSGEATFSGTATSGVLTVTDGASIAHIHLTGDYRSATFVASSDGKGGTMVATVPPPAMAPAHRFVAAAAGLARSNGEMAHAGAALAARAPILCKPHAMTA